MFFDVQLSVRRVTNKFPRHLEFTPKSSRYSDTTPPVVMAEFTTESKRTRNESKDNKQEMSRTGVRESEKK